MYNNIFSTWDFILIKLITIPIYDDKGHKRKR